MNQFVFTAWHYFCLNMCSLVCIYKYKRRVKIHIRFFVVVFAFPFFVLCLSVMFVDLFHKQHFAPTPPKVWLDCVLASNFPFCFFVWSPQLQTSVWLMYASFKQPYSTTGISFIVLWCWMKCYLFLFPIPVKPTEKVCVPVKVTVDLGCVWWCLVC